MATIFREKNIISSRLFHFSGVGALQHVTWECLRRTFHGGEDFESDMYICGQIYEFL